MMYDDAVPIQILRRDTIDRPDDKGQSYATRTWNIDSHVAPLRLQELRQCRPITIKAWSAPAASGLMRRGPAPIARVTAM